MNKKAQDSILPILVLIGVIVGMTTFASYHFRDRFAFERNPFFGQLGRREMHLIAMHNLIEADLFVLDNLGRYALYDTLRDSSQSLFIDTPDCGSFLGSPVANRYDESCFDDIRLSEISGSLSREINANLYSRIIESQVYFPFRYDYMFVQDGEKFKVTGYSRNTVRYPISVLDFTKNEYRPAPRLASEHITIDISNQCTYISAGRNHIPPGSTVQCEGNVCVGPCPDNINIRLVPYFNQCNIPGCTDRYCLIDYQNICNVGCGFKSLQMAYSYYDFIFDEMRSRNTNNVLSLISEMRSSKPSAIQEVTDYCDNIVRDSSECYVDAEYSNPRRINVAGHELELVRALEITDSHYNKILEALDTGLVRLKLSLITDCDPTSNDIGYCIQQHYVLATAGNEDYLIIHDPYTPNRGHRTGINVVVSRDFIKNYWTGHYRHIVGETGSVA